MKREKCVSKCKIENLYLLSPSSRGLGHRPFTAVTGVRIPVGTPNKDNFIIFCSLTTRKQAEKLKRLSSPFKDKKKSE